MKKRSSLRKKLIPILVLLAVIPAIVTSTLAMVQASRLVTGKVTELTVQISDNLAANVDTFIGTIEDQVNTVANLPDVLKVNSVQILPSIKAVAVSNKSILNLYMATSDKEMFLYPETELPAGYDPSTREWYQGAMQAGGSCMITKPYKDAGTGKMVITIAKSIELESGKKAVVAADVDLSILLDSIVKVKVGETGYATLFQEDGVTLAHPDSKMVLVNVKGKFDWATTIFSEKTGNLQYTYNNEKKIMGFTQSKLTGWIAAATIPQKEYAKELNKSIILIISIIFVVLLISAAFGFLIANYVIKPIQKLAQHMKEAEDGDFTIKIDVTRTDEIGQIEQSFKNLIQAQRTIIDGILNSSGELLMASKNMMEISNTSVGAIRNISDSIENIAATTQNNSASLEEANAGIEEMASNSQVVSQTIHMVKQNSETSIHVASTGTIAVGVASSSISKIKASAQEVDTVVGELFSASQEIDTIVNAITSIASQTNLLALNAAIEAARAGDAGKGFAVVADEVRKLAEESNTAANSIGKLIEQIQGKINTAVTTTKKEIEFVEEGIQSNSQVKSAFEEIIRSIQLVDKHIEEVSAAAEEQSAAAHEIAEVVNSINHAVDETVSNTESMSIAAKNQNDTIDILEKSAFTVGEIAEVLAEQTQKFKI